MSAECANWVRRRPTSAASAAAASRHRICSRGGSGGGGGSPRRRLDATERGWPTLTGALRNVAEDGRGLPCR